MKHNIEVNKQDLSFNYEVPHGSSLDPVIFIVYKNNLYKLTTDSKLPFIAFADYYQMHIVFKPPNDKLYIGLFHIEQCICKIRKLFSFYTLSINDNITELIILTRK